jgi:hypothetical protein
VNCSLTHLLYFSLSLSPLSPLTLTLIDTRTSSREKKKRRERGERERERGRERKIEKMSETAIHGLEREREEGRGEKVGCEYLIWCFSLYVNLCNNPSCLILIGGHKGVGLHQLHIEVILLYETYLSE